MNLSIIGGILKCLKKFSFFLVENLKSGLKFALKYIIISLKITILLFQRLNTKEMQYADLSI